MPGQLLCPACHKEHGLSQLGRKGEAHHKWLHAEKIRRKNPGIPPEALAPLRGSDHFLNVYAHGRATDRSGALEGLSWDQYASWLWVESRKPGRKGGLCVTNYSDNGRRREQDVTRIDRLFFDCDMGASWDTLADALLQLGIPAILHESSSSVRKRTDTSAPATKWHVEIPLARSLPNPMHTAGKDDQTYVRAEWKRKYRHTAAVFSALAGFEGVGLECGFDLATSDMCRVRFVGQTANGTVPHVAALPGDRALDWELFLEATGYEPGAKPEPIKPGVIKTRSGGEIHFTGDSLVQAIEDRLTVTEFLDYLGVRWKRKTDNGGHCHCPSHDPSATGSGESFHVWKNGRFWTCHSPQCDTSGGVVKLATRVWEGVEFKEVLARLASLAGIDPNDARFRRRARIVQPDAEPLIDVVPPLHERPGVEPPRFVPPPHAPREIDVLKLPSYEKIVEWIRKTTGPNPSKLAMAISGAILESDLARVETVASTLAHGLWDRLDPQECLAIAASTKHRLEAGKRVLGWRWIMRQVGRLATAKLAKVVARSIGLDVTDTVIKAVGYHRYYRGSRERRFLLEAYSPLPEVKEDPTSVRSLLRRPTGCGEFFNRARADGGIKAEITVTCGVHFLCPTCVMLKAVTEHEIVIGRRLEAAREAKEDEWVISELEKLSWEKRGPFWAVWIELPGFEHVPEVMKTVHRFSKSPRLCVKGVNTETGKPILLYLCEDQLGRGEARSAAMGWAVRTGHQIKYWEKNTVSDLRAAGWVFAQQHSVQLYSDKLVQEDRANDLIEFLLKLKRKPLVSRSPKGLPWPSRQQVRSILQASREEIQDYPEQVITWEAVHKETGIVLGRQDVPYSIDQLISLAAHSTALAIALEEADYARSASSGKAQLALAS